MVDDEGRSIIDENGMTDDRPDAASDTILAYDEKRSCLSLSGKKRHADDDDDEDDDVDDTIEVDDDDDDLLSCCDKVGSGGVANGDIIGILSERSRTVGVGGV